MCVMVKLDKIITHLKEIDSDFYGEVIIKIRAGEAILISKNRTYRLEDNELTEFEKDKKQQE